MQTPVRQVEDFFDNEYCNYAKYTVASRAIPSTIDGFKPSQRKIAYAANKLWKTGNEKPLKVFQLSGQAAAMSFFHHGSLDGTIIGMTQEFKNSMPIFQGIGQFGSLRSPTPGAPRYIGVKFNENFKLLYKDFELVTPKYEEGEEIEPEFFLPIIPTVLLNGSSGIAVGFATNILNRNPLDLIDSCLAVLDKKEFPDLCPWINSFHGKVERVQDSEKSWTFHGKFEIKNTSTIEITEIPPSFTYEKYESHLESLLEKGIIASYDDYSSDRVNYVLKFPRAVLSNLIKKKQLESVLKMREQETENLTTLDEKCNLKIFNNAEEIVRYFVDFRLKYYEKRKAFMLDRLQSEFETLNSKARFVKAVIEKEIEVNNIKKAALIKNIEKISIEKINDSFDYLLSMPIHSLTYEKYQELLKKRDDKKKELEKIQKTEPIDFYRCDLKDLRKEIEKSYK